VIAVSEGTILLKDAKFVVLDASKTVKDLSVGIRGGLITGVGESEELEREGPFDEVIDCRGQVLLPGLINTHTHIHETMMRGLGHDLPFHDWCDRLVFPAAEAMEDEGDELYYNLAQLTAMEAVASGTTAFVEHSVNFAKRHSYTIARAMRDMGFRGAVAKGAEDFSVIDRGHVGPLDRELRETREFLERWGADKPDDLVQAWVGPSGGKRTVGGCTNEGLVELKKLADEFGTRYHVHLAGTEPEIENVRRDTGLPGSVAMVHELGILDERTSLAHCIWTVEEERDILLETGAQIAHCPSCNQICAIGVLPLQDLLRRGVTVGLGTDGGPQNDSFDMFRDMRQAVLLQRISLMQADAVTHGQAFRMATEAGAKVLGVENLGRIEPGFQADIIAVRAEGNLFLTPMYDPLETLVYAGSGGRDVSMTMVHGRVLYQDGEFKTVDSGRVVTEVAGAAERIRDHILL
jgi:5-methylthioadenosine/S-adenosylhomocysteine deaminase